VIFSLWTTGTLRANEQTPSQIRGFTPSTFPLLGCSGQSSLSEDSVEVELDLMASSPLHCRNSNRGTGNVELNFRHLPEEESMGDRLKDKVALVTGAGSSGPGWGNGKAIAVLLAREGVECERALARNRRRIWRMPSRIRSASLAGCPHFARTAPAAGELLRRSVRQGELACRSMLPKTWAVTA
jgi:hypothetical protein